LSSIEDLIPGKEESYFILFVLEIGSLEKIVDGIVEGGGFILERIVRLRQ
jgi:hypothetical protein